ncbi:SUN domain-containing protein, partial [Catenaria anguillulae PL171]
VVIELCNEILIDTLVLSNYELFSSTFRTVRAFVNSVYPETPEKPWRALATLAAANVRSPQVFVVDRAVTWARYVRLEFVDQYGSQYFCPLSNIRVYGTTMLEEYKRDAD